MSNRGYLQVSKRLIEPLYVRFLLLTFLIDFPSVDTQLSQRMQELVYMLWEKMGEADAVNWKHLVSISRFLFSCSDLLAQEMLVKHVFPTWMSALSRVPAGDLFYELCYFLQDILKEHASKLCL
jgi:hypothetical protein